MASVLLKNVNKVYPGGTQAVYDLSLDIRDKEFIVLTGPSGCGKSTTLRMIAGLEEITSGELYIDGKLMNDVVPKDRDISMVFQNCALYPNMTVYENMAFGLKMRKVPKEIIDDKVRRAAEVLGISDLLTRKPKALTGGQRQRVALGRMMVREPKVFLLDEPLSNLDPKLRSVMKTEIAKLHSRMQTTFVYITHDPAEAMTMGSRIVVMKEGFLQQADTPQNLYDYPANKFVAGFIGSPRMNFYKETTLTESDGKVYANFVGGNRIALPRMIVARIKNPDEYLNTGKPVTLGIRPEDIHLDEVFVASSPETVVKAKVDFVELLGADKQISCDVDYKTEKGAYDERISQMQITASSRADVKVGEVIDVALDAKHIHLFDGEDEFTLLNRDEHYEKLTDTETDAAFVPLTPRQMKARIDASKANGKEKKNKKK